MNALRLGVMLATAAALLGVAFAHPQTPAMLVGLAPLGLIALEACWRLLAPGEDERPRDAARMGRWLAAGAMLALFVLLALLPPPVLAEDGLSRAAAGASIFAAALVSSVAGFAFSALAGAPLLFILGDPVHAVAIMVVCSTAIQAYCVWALRRAIMLRRLVPFVAGGALTVPLGVWLLTRTPPSLFAIGLGVFMTAYATYMLCRRAPPVVGATWRTDALAGALGGIAGGLAGFPGAFVTIWCGVRGWSKEAQRAVYQPYILAMQLEAWACLRLHSPHGLAEQALWLYAALALLGACVGFAVYKRLSTRQFAYAVNALLLVSGVTLFSGAFRLAR